MADATATKAEPEVWGKLTLTPEEAELVQRTETCEFAAWYTQHVALPGEYPITALPKDNPGAYAGTAFGCDVAGEVLDDNYQSHFGGVACGRPYDRFKNAGKPGKVGMAFSALQMLTDPRVTVPEDRVDALVEMAIGQAIHDEQWRLKSLLEQRGDGQPSTDRYRTVHYGHAAEFYAKAAATLEALTLFRTHREQRAQAEAECQKVGGHTWQEDPRPALLRAMERVASGDPYGLNRRAEDALRERVRRSRDARAARDRLPGADVLEGRAARA